MNLLINLSGMTTFVLLPCVVNWKGFFLFRKSTPAACRCPVIIYTNRRVKDPKKTPYGYLDCGRGLVRVIVIYLEYTRPRGQARVYRFDIHRKSLRPEEYIWKLWKLNVSLVKDYIKSLKCSGCKKYAYKNRSILCCEFFPFISLLFFFEN